MVLVFYISKFSLGGHQTDNHTNTSSARCDSWLLCTTQILLLTYLLPGNSSVTKCGRNEMKLHAQCLVTTLKYRCYINKFIYLSIYTQHTPGMVPAMMSTVDDDDADDPLCAACCCCWWLCISWCRCISGQVRSSSMYSASGMAHDDCGMTCSWTTLLSWPRADCSLIRDWRQ